MGELTMAKKRQPRRTDDSELRAAWVFHALARRLDGPPDPERLAEVCAAYVSGIDSAKRAPTWPDRLSVMAAAFACAHPQHWTRDCQRTAERDFDRMSADERRAFADAGGLELVPHRPGRHCFDSAATIARRTAQRRVMGWQF
ncbi:MAG: hypothetical protein ACRDK8_10665 [Solirubrobacteraceae bacterium]